jgi:drug/metabolite transporter (DMT)-like permease
MGLTEWAILIGLSLLWGGSFFFIELAIVDVPTLTLVWLRVTIAALCLWGVVLARGIEIPKSRTVWLPLLFMGLFNNALPFCLIVWGQHEIPSGLAAIFNATMPLFTVLVAGVFLADESFTTLKVIGVLLGFSGVIAMIGPTQLVQLEGPVLAQVAILGAAFCYAIASTYGRRFRRMSVPLIVTAAGQVTCASLLLAPIALYVDGVIDPTTVSLSSTMAVVSLGVFCTALAYVGYFRILASSGATNLSLVTFLVPVSAIFLGWMFLNESLQWIHYVGMGLIALGLAAIDGRPLYWIIRKSSSQA